MKRYVVTLARWIANKTVKAQWEAQGRKPKIGELSKASNVYFTENIEDLIAEAWEHPAAKEWRRKERMRLARKAVEAEISRGGKVSSIEPQEIRRLVDAYVKDHPEESEDIHLFRRLIGMCST